MMRSCDYGRKDGVDCIQMRRRLSNKTACILAALGVIIGLGNAPFAAAQGEAPLRVTVSTSGREVLDTLLAAIAARAGVTNLAIAHDRSVSAVRDFCRNQPGESPDIVLVTHHVEPAVISQCAQNGATDVAGVEMAHDPLILAERKGSPLTSLTSRQVYLAVAREVPYRDDFTRNISARWSDIDPALPPQDIRFELPMRDEGSRTTFNWLVLQSGCRDEDPVKQIFDARKRELQCITTRSDRIREIPHPQALKTLLDAPAGTIGVLSQSELAQSNGELVALTLDGMSPTPAAVASGTYDYSTTFWLYAKINRNATDRLSLDVAKMVNAAQSDAIIGPQGPLAALDLTPLPEEERAAQRAALAEATQPYSVMSMLSWVSDATAEAWRMFGPRPSEAAIEAAGPPMDFTSLMDIAGYQISSVRSSIGIIPDASMTFGIARQMSDADHEYLDRLLRRDALARPGALSAFQRRIIRSIMDVQSVGGFQVSKVEIDFLPLPAVSLEVTPEDSAGSHHSDDGSGGTD